MKDHAAPDGPNKSRSQPKPQDEKGRSQILGAGNGAGVPSADGAPKARSGRWRTLLARAAVLSAGLAAMLAVSGCMIYASISSGFRSPEKMAVNQPAGGALILDRNGQVLFQYIDEDNGLRKPVPLEQVSDHLLAATIATEDANFYSNPGVNIEGLGRAAWENFSPFSGSFLKGSGGSSITQQLVKRLYFDADEQASRSLDRKLREVVYALKLNERYSKEQILTWYVNEISYGGVYLGIEAASEGYFGKPASELTLAEAALLAGIPQSPARYDPRTNPEGALQRRNQVLDLLAQYESVQVRGEGDYAVNRDEIEAAKAAPIELAPQADFVLNAPHFVLTYLEPELDAMFGHEALLKDGLVVTTSLDLNLQTTAEKTLEKHIAAFEAGSNTHNGAMVVIDPRSGELLAMVGSRDYNRDDIQGKNNNLLALNSPGSSFKPFVYLGLFLKDNLGPGAPIDDSPVRYTQPDGSVFSPRNPDGRNHGWVTIRNALGNSFNVTAFRAAQRLGVPEVVRIGKAAGLTELNGSYGPSIAIGGVDVKPLDLAYAYSVLANGGVMRGQKAIVPHENGEREVDPVSILQVTRNDGEVVYEAQRTEQRVFPEQHVFLVNSILSDPGAQCVTFGCGGLAVSGHTVAVKTGTSEPFDPNGPNRGKIGETWAFGYTPEVVVGVWAGNADNAPITNITSSSIAFRAMRDVVVAYYGGKRSTPFRVPDGVVRTNACYVEPVRMCVTDYFLEQSLQGLARSQPGRQTDQQDRSGGSSLQRRIEEQLRQLEDDVQDEIDRALGREENNNRERNGGNGNNGNGRRNNDDD